MQKNVSMKSLKLLFCWTRFEQVENQSSIFDIKNLKCALEHCEDEAFAEEDKIKVDVKTQEVKEEGDVKEECKESEKLVTSLCVICMCLTDSLQ